MYHTSQICRVPNVLKTSQTTFKNFVCKNYGQIWLFAGARVSRTRFRGGVSEGSEGPKCVMATFDTSRSVTDSMQSISASIQELPDSVVEWVSRLRYSVDESGEIIRLSISLRLAVDFLHVKCKAIPFQAWTGPEGSRRLRLPDTKTIGTRRW